MRKSERRKGPLPRRINYGPSSKVEMGAGGDPHPNSKGGGSYVDPTYKNPKSEASERALKEDGKGNLKPYDGKKASVKAKAAKRAFQQASRSKGKR